MNISVQQLKESTITIVFHVDGKEYAPVMDKENMSAVKMLAALSVEQLVEVSMDLKVKVGGKK